MHYKGGHCGICRHPGWLSPFFFFIIFLLSMHPSSFYDLRARYIYTPLYGPYSLSEALEGLVFYSLDESRDSISIGSKRTLRHELISELSNVMDDLQDYLIYFSSNFLIFPLNSPDLFKELRAGCDGFEPLSIRWGAIITGLVVARKIVEHNFWPRFFRPVVNNLTSFQRRQCPPFALPNVSSDKLPASMSASTFISSPHMDNTHCSPYCLLESQCPPFNAQSERPQTMPSTSNPTGGKEDHLSSLRLKATSTLSGSCLTRVPMDQQSSVTPLESFFPQKYENRPDELIVPPNCAVATQGFNSSTSAHNSETRGVRDLEGNAKGVGPNEQVSEEMEGVTEGKEVVRVLCAHPHPAPLTFIRTEATGEPIRVAATASSSPTASRSTSAPSLSESTIPFAHSFASASSRSLTTLSPKKWHTQYSTLHTPFHSISITQNRSRKMQTRRFTPPLVNSPTTPPFQQ